MSGFLLHLETKYFLNSGLTNLVGLICPSRYFAKRSSEGTERILSPTGGIY